MRLIRIVEAAIDAVLMQDYDNSTNPSHNIESAAKQHDVTPSEVKQFMKERNPSRQGRSNGREKL
jgi:hypothetical protein